MSKADSPTKSCTHPGCTKPLRARGLCSTHYNLSRYSPGERHPKQIVVCDQCGKQCAKAEDRSRGYGGRFCSLNCRDAWRVATGNNPAPSFEARAASIAARRTRLAVARRKLKRAARGQPSGQSAWVAGSCAQCGASFVALRSGDDLGRYCSDTCKHRASHARRRARERSTLSEPYSRHKIFERDGWRCHICKRKTLRSKAVPHPKAPVIDHLIPLVEGGSDTAANVATAHFICNSIKSDRGGGDQLALIG